MNQKYNYKKKGVFMSNEEMALWVMGAGALYWTRLKVAAYVIEQTIKEYEPQLQAFREFKPVEWKAQTPEQKEAFADFQAAKQTNDILVKNAQELKIPLPVAVPEILNSSQNFQSYIDSLKKLIKHGIPSEVVIPAAHDALTDAILNEALLRAFPKTAFIAGAGESSDVLLGPELKEMLDRTGVIDATAAMLTDMAQIVSEGVVVSVGEAIADPQLAVFSLYSIINRERKLIQAGHSTLNESATYGTLDYGGRLAGAALGSEAAREATEWLCFEELIIPCQVLGGLFGFAAAKTLWKNTLKEEITDLTKEYERTTTEARDDLELKKKNILEKTGAVAKKTFGEYKTVVHACPDLTKRADLAATAQKLLDASHKDAALASALVKSKRDTIMVSVSEPGFIPRALGANWKKAMERHLDQIEKTHNDEIGILRYDFTAAGDPLAILLKASKTPSAQDGYTEKAYAALPGEINSILSKHRDEATAWSISCKDSWKKAADETIGTLNAQQNIFSDAYTSIKNNLEYLQRRIFSKGMRLHPDYS